MDKLRPLSFQEGIFAFTFGIAPVFMNLMKKKPGNAGIQKHILAAALGLFVGNRFENYQRQRQIRKNQFLVDYMAQFPDDFVEPPRQKWKDVFEEWRPAR